MGETLELSGILRQEMGVYLCIASNNVPPSVIKRYSVDVHCTYTLSSMMEFPKKNDNFFSSLPRFRLEKLKVIFQNFYSRIVFHFTLVGYQKLEWNLQKNLSVSVQPVIKVTNTLLAAPIGSNVVLQCHVEASPHAMNTWYRNTGNQHLQRFIVRTLTDSSKWQCFWFRREIINQW